MKKQASRSNEEKGMGNMQDLGKKIRKKIVHQEGEIKSVWDVLYNVVKNVAVQLDCLYGDLLG